VTKRLIDKNGFSLLELLVVLSIISTILYIAAPNFFRSFDNFKTKQLFRNMVADIRTTRIQSINTGQQQVWTIDLENRQFWSTVKNKKQSYKEDVNVTLTTASREQQSNKVASIRFFPNGSSTGARLELNKSTFTYVAEVDWLTGMLTLHD